MKTINKICVYFVIIIVALIAIHMIGNNSLTNIQEHNIIDTVYNRVIIDSIKYDIKRKDSIIIDIKRKVEYEVEQANNVSDSVAVNMFKQLAIEQCSLYGGDN